LQELGVDVQWRNYDKEPFTSTELERLLEKQPVERFLATRSPSFKALGLEGRRITKSQAIRYILKESNLLRRPLVVSGSTYIFGLNEVAYRKLAMEQR
jgi:arsenate reductase-like glutaredoxin family protein